MTAAITYALDASVRRRDVDGRLHVKICNISKANVCPYLGREIPGWQELGLDADRVYQLYRDPDELARAAASSNNIQLLDIHIPVSAADPKKDRIVGSTGTDGVFEAPYLKNSLVIWDDKAIAGIESGKQRKLSCSYRYDPDMTPGSDPNRAFSWDGVMRNIVFNHVALVEAGRAGPDVLVGDSKLEMLPMSEPLRSKKALLVRGALTAVTRPLLAADAKIDLNAVLAGVNRENYPQSHTTIFDRLTLATKGKLAADASLEPIKDVLLALDEEDCDAEDDEIEEESEEDRQAKAAKDKAAKDKAAKDKRARDKAARDARARDENESEQIAEEDDDEEKKKAAKDKKAMDAAIDAALAVERDRTRLLRDAERDVRPLVGEVTVACDSAEAVYRFALDANQIPHKGITELPALRQMVAMLPKPGAMPVIRVANDSADRDAFAKRFPNAQRFGRA